MNGAIAIVKKLKCALQSEQLEEGELPDCVLMKFDDGMIRGRMEDDNG